MLRITSEGRFSRTLAAARGGEEAAWRELYLELAPSVLGYLRVRGMPDEDLGGEVFLQVVRDLPRFSGDERQFRAWVLSIARNRLIDERRRRARRPVESAPEEVLVSEGPVGNVEAEALAGLGMKDLLRLVAQLSPDQQDVLVLRLVADLTVEEVASAVGKRPGAVKALQRRGLLAIAKSMGDLQR
ncbi:MAG: RNA polymerase sigma factor [Thermoleophilaceae bacterium]